MSDALDDLLSQPWDEKDAFNHPLTDGKYTLEINSAHLDVSKAGNKQIVWNMTVITAHEEANKELEGTEFNKYTMLKDEQNVKFAKNELFKLGLGTPSSAAELEAMLAKAAEIRVITDCVTKKEFQNYYYRQVVTD